MLVDLPALLGTSCNRAFREQYIIRVKYSDAQQMNCLQHCLVNEISSSASQYRYTRGGSTDDQDNHCNNCRKPDKSSARQGFRRVLAPFGGDLAAYARVAAIVDQALSTEDDGGSTTDGGGETPGTRWSLASAGSVARASLSSFGSDLGVALDAVLEISPQRVLAGILQSAAHSDGVRDEKAEKDDLGRFGFTFELCVVLCPSTSLLACWC